VAYRSNRIDPADGVEILRDIPPPGRRRNVALDVLTLPVVAMSPRKTVAVLGTRLALHYDFRRWTWRTERCIELAVGGHVLSGRDPDDVLELGNVLPLAGMGGHTVVDKYERGQGVLNVDIVDYAPKRRFALGMSLSTLEHVGWDEEPRDPGKAAIALQRLSDLVDDLLVTIPAGVHRDLERAVIGGPFDSVELLVKTSRRGDWEPRGLAELPSVRYAWPYACGNGILVAQRGLAAGG
jgi:hypothetical protein